MNSVRSTNLFKISFSLKNFFKQSLGRFFDELFLKSLAGMRDLECTSGSLGFQGVFAFF